jgi:hypothetical protein
MLIHHNCLKTNEYDENDVANINKDGPYLQIYL